MTAAEEARGSRSAKLVTPIGTEPSRLRQMSLKEYSVRFVFGGLVTATVGVLGAAFGPSFAGLFLAFPAILVASLTLIGSHDGDKASGADALGAAVGAIGLMGFAIIIWALSNGLAGAAVLAVASAVWLVVSITIWTIFDALRRARKG
ncbi:MAG TPA: DUF3147 family protein [Chloroflexota bacterium]